MDSSILERLKGRKIKIDPAVRVSDSFLGEDLNLYFLALICTMSLKYFSKSANPKSFQIIIANVFSRKYELSKFLGEALLNSPNLCERCADSLVFLETAAIISINKEKNNEILITERGNQFLKSFSKDKPNLYRNLKIGLSHLKKEGLSFI